jgi:GTP-binding protein EngB required for normal cell division
MQEEQLSPGKIVVYGMSRVGKSIFLNAIINHNAHARKKKLQIQPNTSEVT